MTRRVIVGSILFLASVPGVRGHVIDHESAAAVPSLPQATMDAIAGQKWFFAHASVGGNMVAGMNDLHGASPGRYRLMVSSVGYNSTQMRANDPPAPTVPDTIYECNRGNPGWSNKISIFANSVRTSGWHDAKVGIVMDKFCYIDQTADASSYLTSMHTLETEYPNTVFVYATMPLMDTQDYDNFRRNQFNAAVRTYCVSNDRLLFDIADVEAHDPDGVEYTFTYSGSTYQKLYVGYTSDGGHLNTLGRDRVALGWYATAVAIATQLSATIHGTAVLQNFVGDNATVQITVRLTPAGGGAQIVRSVALGTDGTFTLDNITVGTYAVSLQTSGFLRAGITGRTLVPGTNELGTILLTGGDANGDNRVTFEDFAVLQNNFGTTGRTRDQGDFDGNGQVTFADFAILQNAYGRTGLSGAMASPAAADARDSTTCGLLGLAVMLLLGSALGAATPPALSAPPQ